VSGVGTRAAGRSCGPAWPARRGRRKLGWLIGAVPDRRRAVRDGPVPPRRPAGQSSCQRPTLGRVSAGTGNGPEFPRPAKRPEVVPGPPVRPRSSPRPARRQRPEVPGCACDRTGGAPGHWLGPESCASARAACRSSRRAGPIAPAYGRHLSGQHGPFHPEAARPQGGGALVRAVPILRLPVAHRAVPAPAICPSCLAIAAFSHDPCVASYPVPSVFPSAAAGPPLREASVGLNRTAGSAISSSGLSRRPRRSRAQPPRSACPPSRGACCHRPNAGLAPRPRSPGLIRRPCSHRWSKLPVGEAASVRGLRCRSSPVPHLVRLPVILAAVVPAAPALGTRPCPSCRRGGNSARDRPRFRRTAPAAPAYPHFEVIAAPDGVRTGGSGTRMS